MNRFDVTLVFLVPIMCLFSIAVLPLIYFIHYGLKLSLSLILVGTAVLVTLVLLVKRKYTTSDMFKILLGPIFSLVGYVFSIWTVYLWYNMSAILFELALTGVGVVLSLVLLRRKTRERTQAEDDFDNRSAEDRLTTYLETGKTEGPLSRTPPVSKESIIRVVFFIIVGIIGAFLVRPPSANPDIVSTIGLGILLGLFGVCYSIFGKKGRIVTST